MVKKFTLGLFLALSSTSLWAQCTPETIQFYLDKGFTQEQITKLCAQSTDSTPSYQPYQKPVVIVQEGHVGNASSVDERRAIGELRGGIDGRSVEVTATHLNYITNICIRAGNSPEKDQRIDKCIDVAFSVARDGLKITESGSAFLLFGQRQVDIESSDIVRKYVTADPWAAFPPNIRFSLERKFKSQEIGNTTTIPLRSSASPAQIGSAIRTLSSATEQRLTGNSESEVAKVLDEKYVPPTEEEYLTSQPTYEEVQEEKKKNKKWWNPFD